jgi:hypothetical protein
MSIAPSRPVSDRGEGQRQLARKQFVICEREQRVAGCALDFGIGSAELGRSHPRQPTAARAFEGEAQLRRRGRLGQVHQREPAAGNRLTTLARATGDSTVQFSREHEFHRGWGMGVRGSGFGVRGSGFGTKDQRTNDE